MAIIDTVISGSEHGLIRDRIAQILADEIGNQQTLNPSVNYPSRIFVERGTDFNYPELPAMNVSIGEINYTDNYQVQRMVDVTFWIDVYSRRKDSDQGGAGELATKEALYFSRVVQFILDHPHYKTLLFGNAIIFDTQADAVNIGRAASDESAKVSAARVLFTVRTLASGAFQPHTDLNESFTTVQLNESEEGFFYQTNI